jgi:hypothetical protein
MNALAVGYFLGVPSLMATPVIIYETDVADGCTDGLDNDLDGLIDCGDPDCVSVDPCVAPAPALGPLGLVGGAVMLLLIGGAALRVRRREDQ